MDIAAVITTVLATVAGSVVIAYTTMHLQTKYKKRSLFRALLSEVEWNHSLAEHLKDDSLESLKRYTPLHTEAYQNFRLTGELLNLPGPIRRNLVYTYEMINTHNWEIEQGKIAPPGGVYFAQRNDEILEKLTFLEEELPKAMKHLKQERR
jgi:ankyrin repeat protein